MPTGYQTTAFSFYPNRPTPDVIDFTEERLIRRMTTTRSRRKVNELGEVLARYVGGEVAVAWQDGEPVVVPVKH
jgi:hypothetical protein